MTLLQIKIRLSFLIMNKLLGISFVFILLTFVFSNNIKSDLNETTFDGKYLLSNAKSLSSHTKTYVCSYADGFSNAAARTLGMVDENINAARYPNSILGEVYIIHNEEFAIKKNPKFISEEVYGVDVSINWKGYISLTSDIIEIKGKIIDRDDWKNSKLFFDGPFYNVESYRILTEKKINELNNSCRSIGNFNLLISNQYNIDINNYDFSNEYMVIEGYHDSGSDFANEIPITIQFTSILNQYEFTYDGDDCGIYQNIKAPYGFIKHIYFCKYDTVNNNIYDATNYDPNTSDYLIFQLKKNSKGISLKLPKYDGYVWGIYPTDTVYEFTKVNNSGLDDVIGEAEEDIASTPISQKINTQKIINDLTPMQINQVILEDKDTGLIIFDQNLNTLRSDDLVKQMRNKELELKKLKEKSEDSFINNAEIGIDASASGGIDIGPLDADASVSTDIQSTIDRELAEKYIDEKIEVEDYKNRIIEGNNFEKTACMTYINIYNEEQILICQKYIHPADQDHLKYIPRKLDNFKPYIGYDSESVF